MRTQPVTAEQTVRKGNSNDDKTDRDDDQMFHSTARHTMLLATTVTVLGRMDFSDVGGSGDGAAASITTTTNATTVIIQSSTLARHLLLLKML